MTADAWDLWEYSHDSYDVAANNITTWLAVLQQDPVARRRYDDLRHVSLDVLTGSTDPSYQYRLSESDADDEHAPPPLSACVAARSLANATSFSDVYIEELKDRGGVQLLVKLLASSDEMVVEAAATAIANCSGPLAARPAVKGFTFGGVDVKVSLVRLPSLPQSSFSPDCNCLYIFSPLLCHQINTPPILPSSHPPSIPLRRGPALNAGPGNELLGRRTWVEGVGHSCHAGTPAGSFSRPPSRKERVGPGEWLRSHRITRHKTGREISVSH